MSKHTVNRTRSRWSRVRQHLAQDRWVDVLVDFGKPIVLVVVLGISVPSEHRIGVLSGYGWWWSWAMPVVYAVYAALCAGIAGTKEKGEKGRGSAIAGAGFSLALAMSAQVIAHLYDLGIWDDSSPKDRIPLVVGGSVVGALVLAHLVHVAAGTVRAARAVREEAPVVDVAPAPAPAPVRDWISAPAGARILLAGCCAHPAVTMPDPNAGPVPYGYVTTKEAAGLTARAESTVRGWVANGTVRSMLATDGSGARWIEMNSLPLPQPRQLAVVGG